MDNLPKDPPPQFGSDFDPHSNPIDPDNPYQSLPSQPAAYSSHYHQVQSELASHRHRDNHGRFESESSLASSNPSNPSSPYKPSSPDDPIFEAKINNPFSTFFNWIKNFLKRNQNITIKIPIIGILVVLSSFGAGLGSGYNWGFNSAAATFFPDSSPVFHRPISVDGVVQKSSAGKLYLRAEDNYTWILKTVNPDVNLSGYVNQQVTAKGNLTKEKGVIEVSEIISPDSSGLIAPIPAYSSLPANPSFPSDPSDSSILPALFSGLQWETNQKKVLIFTSGKRKIEQEGVYLESAQLSAFPQDFINYYIEGLKAAGFKETLNSISPEGITITYAKDDSFLTFGIKNVYKGTGNQKQLSGFKAFVEHN